MTTTRENSTLGDRVRVAFQLPLSPRHFFTPAALAELAALIEGGSVYAPDDAGRADLNFPIGTVLSAVVAGEVVRCDAEIERHWAEIAGGYGINGTATAITTTPLSSKRVIEGLRDARVVAVRPDALPVGAPRPTILDGVS